jgi:hypothetical protein
VDHASDWGHAVRMWVMGHVRASADYRKTCVREMPSEGGWSSADGVTGGVPLHSHTEVGCRKDGVGEAGLGR